MLGRDAWAGRRPFFASDPVDLRMFGIRRTSKMVVVFDSATGSRSLPLDVACGSTALGARPVGCSARWALGPRLPAAAEPDGGHRRPDPPGRERGRRGGTLSPPDPTPRALRHGP